MRVLVGSWLDNTDGIDDEEGWELGTLLGDWLGFRVRVILLLRVLVGSWLDNTDGIDDEEGWELGTLLGDWLGFRLGN